jgi:cell division septation protein DedD
MVLHRLLQFLCIASAFTKGLASSLASGTTAPNSPIVVISERWIQSGQNDAFKVAYDDFASYTIEHKDALMVVNSLDPNVTDLSHDVQWFPNVAKFMAHADMNNDVTAAKVNAMMMKLDIAGFPGCTNCTKPLKGVVFGGYDDSVKAMTQGMMAQFKYVNHTSGYIRSVMPPWGGYTGDPVIAYSTRKVKPGQMDALVAAHQLTADHYYATEPGVLAIIMGPDSDDANLVHDLQIFANLEAFVSHVDMTHNTTSPNRSTLVMSWMDNYDPSSMPYIVGPAWSSNSTPVKAEMDKFYASFTQLQYAPNAGAWDCSVWSQKPTWMTCPPTPGLVTDVIASTQKSPESAVMLADGSYLVSSINDGVGGIYKYTNGAEVTTFNSSLSANTMTAGLALTAAKTTLFAAHRTGMKVTQYTVGDSGLTMVKDFNPGFEPNGLCLSEDESKLYVAAHGWFINTQAMMQGNEPVMKNPGGDGGGFAVITLATGDVQTVFTNDPDNRAPNGCVVQGDYVYMITFQGGVASYKISDGTIVNMTSWSNNFINLQTGSPKLAGDGIAYANGKFYISLWSMMMVPGQGVAPATGSSIIECDPSGMAFCKPFSEMAAADIEIFDNKIVAPQILASKVSSIPIIEMVPAPAPKPTEAPTEAPTSAPTEAPTSAPTAAPTQAPTPAASTPTSGEQKVLLTLAITGLDYTKLNANATLKTSVENSVKTSTLASLPQGYTTDHISVTFSAGVATTATGGRRLTMSQVIADVQISPMSGSDVDALKQTVTTSKDTIGGATTSSVKTIEGVTAVMDDNASLSDLTTAASEPSTITIPITTVAPASDTSAAFGRTTFVLLPLATAAVLAH